MCVIKAGDACTGVAKLPSANPPDFPIKISKNSSNQFVKLSPSIAL